MVLHVSKVITMKQWTKGLVTTCGPISGPLPILFSLHSTELVAFSRGKTLK